MDRLNARQRVRRIKRRKIVATGARWTWHSIVASLVALAVLSVATASISAYFNRQAAPDNAVVTVAAIPDRPAIRFWGDEVPDNLRTAVNRLVPNMPRLAVSARQEDGRPLVNYLALSGGGSDGAFGAGLLSGWSQTGQRPSFEVVTGVSAGALIAPFAFLGSEYDAALKDVWTSYGTKDVAPRRWVGFLGGPSITNTAPLKRIIARYIDKAMLARIAAEYQKGRLLLVVTTNLDAQRPVVWNIGEIAASGAPHSLDLVHQVLMASSAIPGMFPPVNIRVKGADGSLYDEMHVDGGVTREVFVAPAQLSFRSFDVFYQTPPKRQIYIIKNGKTEPEYAAVKASTLSIVERSLYTMIKSHQFGDIYRIYRMAKDDGVRFQIAAVPPEFDVRAKEIFDKAYLAALFSVGEKQGRQGGQWMDEPPEYRPLSQH